MPSAQRNDSGRGAPRSSQDVDEHLASRVLAFVEDTPTRVALACVNRTWRKVATRPGCWEPRDELVLEGPLAAKLTHERMWRVLLYAGPHLRRIHVSGFGVLHDAGRERDGFATVANALCDYVILANQRFMYRSWEHKILNPGLYAYHRLECLDLEGIWPRTQAQAFARRFFELIRVDRPAFHVLRPEPSSTTSVQLSWRRKDHPT